VNVAVELTGDRPVEPGALTGTLDACVPGDRFETVEIARRRLEYEGTKHIFGIISIEATCRSKSD
jgi:hypothetical protein